MGNFQAYNSVTDTEVTFDSEEFDILPKKSNATPPLVTYYKCILKAALGNLFKPKEKDEEKFTALADEGNNISTFIKRLNECWTTIKDSHLIGYIQNDDEVLKKTEDIFNTIALEENNYYWRWLDNKNDVLNQEDKPSHLRIVNGRLLNIIFISRTHRIHADQWIKNEKDLQDNSLIAPAIAICPTPNFFHGEEYYGVYVNDNAKLFFLDEKEDTQKFIYSKTGSGDYKKVKTFKYDKSVLSEYILKGLTNDILEHSLVVNEAIPQKGRGGKPKSPIPKDTEALIKKKQDYRYLYFIKNVQNTLGRADFEEEESEEEGEEAPNLKNDKKVLLNIYVNNILQPYFQYLKKVGQIKGIGFLNNSNPAEFLLSKIKFKDTAPQPKREEFKNLIKAKAEKEASLLPYLHHCFYYASDDGDLKGFISNVHIGEGRQGGSIGYLIRADKVDEMDYRWRQDLNKSVKKDPLKLLADLIGLESDKMVTKHERSKRRSRKEATEDLSGYSLTNTPFDKNKAQGFKTPAIGMNSLIKYYKKIEVSGTNKKRNLPSNPNVPRLAIARGNNISKNIKLNNHGFRVWKKIDSESNPIVLGRGNTDRFPAGEAMAYALGKFHIFPQMKKSEVLPKVENSKLSATAFVKFALGNDQEFKKQWKKDNDHITSTVTANNLRTDQEWCHLIGHGDGGPEELGNFVSGSKHCNTEQLAIEVGQRRVSHYNYDPKTEMGFKDTEREKLTAKITAYLIPNEGTWIEGEFDRSKLVKIFGYEFTDEQFKNKEFINKEFIVNLNKFFKEKEGKYSLKLNEDTNNKELRKAFEELSKDIRGQIINKNTKNKLFQFRSKLEKHFFMYLPIARWMRYKIYYDNTKVFDHIYDAQSESMDINECKILDYTVERTLYMAIAKDAAKERKEKIIKMYNDNIIARAKIKLKLMESKGSEDESVKRIKLQLKEMDTTPSE